MAQSVRRIQYADSVPVQNDRMASDRGLLGGVGRGAVPKHDDRRRLKHYITGGKNVTLQPPSQQRLKWETDRESVSRINNPKPKRHNEFMKSFYAHDERKMLQRSGSSFGLRDVEIRQSKLLQHEERVDWHEQSESSQKIRTERKVARRRHDVGEIRRNRMKNIFDLDPPAAKSSYYHHRNRLAKGKKSSQNQSKATMNKSSSNFGSDSDESNIEAGDKESVVKRTERVAHPWQRPSDGETDNASIDDATKNNKLPSKWERRFSCEIKNSEVALFSHSLFRNGLGDCDEHEEEEEQSRTHSQSTKNRGCPHQPLDLLSVYVWFLGMSSDASDTSSKKKNKKNKKIVSKSMETLSHDASLEPDHFLIASTKKRVVKAKQKRRMSQSDVQKHNLLMIRQSIVKIESIREEPNISPSSSLASSHHEEQEQGLKEFPHTNIMRFLTSDSLGEALGEGMAGPHGTMNISVRSGDSLGVDSLFGGA
mmetsp:Transcript_66636/g.98808  ORF Transcript_66636/g.98808 Transcript_66636/m.98808 type:complete len:480 (+) Transcript_66636:36-1475(+)